MFTRLLLSVKSDLAKAGQLWQKNSDRNPINRVFYLLWRMIRAISLRVFFYSPAFFKVGFYKFQLIWQETSQRNLVYRVFYLLWRLVRAIFLKGFHPLRLLKLKIAHKATTVFHAYFARILRSDEGTFNLLSINYFLSFWYKNIKYDNSVLHISYMVHIPYYTTRTLRKYGLKADYLAVGGQSPWWNQYDYTFLPSSPWQEFLFFWKVVARYEVIHSHFGIMLSRSGWELPVLKRLGRKIVVHYRGCEVRDPDKNMALHPQVNICQVCDYNRSVCREGKERVNLAQKYGDLFLVTTPDMRDFVPEAIHFPFFTPEIEYEQYAPVAKKCKPGDEFKIVHVTNHPGIEGTEQIQAAVERLCAKGYKINFVFLRGVTPEQVLQEYRDADLSIGKMKMGYYANAQIESMFLGVPAVTYVRPEFMTPELESSGLIFTTLADLENTLEYYLTHPEELEKKRQIARSSILQLHHNERLAQQLIEAYAHVKARHA